MVAAALLLSYLLGSFPSAYIVGKLVRGIDLRRFGSGNVGTMNARAVLGYPAALLVLLLDAGKGALAAYLAGQMSLNPYIGLVVSVFAHIYPIWLKGEGGKGLATGLGGLLLLQQWLLIIAFGLIWTVFYAIKRNADQATIAGMVAFVIYAVLSAPPSNKWWLVLLGFFVILKHIIVIYHR